MMSPLKIFFFLYRIEVLQPIPRSPSDSIDLDESFLLMHICVIIVSPL